MKKLFVCPSAIEEHAKVIWNCIERDRKEDDPKTPEQVMERLLKAHKDQGIELGEARSETVVDGYEVITWSPAMPQPQNV